MKKQAKHHNKKKTLKTEKTSINIKHYYLLFAIIAATFIAYLPAINNDFVRWDDDWYVENNHYIKTLEISNVKSIFTDFFKGQYSPVSTLVLASIYQIGKLNPVFYHSINILLHLLNTFLVFWFLRLLLENIFKRKSIEIALIATLLFAVNSMQVESVAWVSAIKVVLYTSFFLASLIAYLKYIFEKKAKFYVYSIIFFLLSFGAKEQAVTLSITIIAIDYFLNRKLLSGKLILEKIPFILLSIVLGVVTIYSSRTGEFFEDKNTGKFFEQIVYASFAFTHYILKLILPLKLSAFYPYPKNTGGLSLFTLSLYIIPVLAVIFSFWLSLKRNKIVAFGIMFFIINIILVLQLLPLRDFIMADRYIYIPSIGAFLIFAFYFVKFLDKKPKNRNFTISALIIYSVVLLSISFIRNDVWKDSITLFSDIVEKYPESSVGWNNRGLANSNIGNDKKAVSDYSEAIRINRTSVFAYNNRGISYSNLNHFNKAIADFNIALQLSPDFLQGYYNRADTYGKYNKIAEAIADYTKVIELRPKFANAYTQRGLLLAKSGNFKKALPDMNRAIELQSNSAEFYMNRGVVSLNLKDFQSSINDFSKAISLKPNFKMAYFNRGLAKINSGKINEGCNDMQKAYQLGYSAASGFIQKYCGK